MKYFLKIKLIQIIVLTLLVLVLIIPSYTQAVSFSCVNNQPPIAVIDPHNSVAQIGEAVVFSAENSSDPDASSNSDSRLSSLRSRVRNSSQSELTYYWKVADLGIEQSGKTLKLSPKTPGQYELELTVSDDCDSSTTSTTLTIAGEITPPASGSDDQPQTAQTCEQTKLIQSGSRGDTHFQNLGLDTSAHPEILQYRIQWFNGNWSPWYTPGVDDIDWKTNLDDTQRRVWSYFADHSHEYIVCVDLLGENPVDPNAQKVDFVVEDIEYKEVWGGMRHAIRARVCNRGNIGFKSFEFFPEANPGVSTQFELNGKIIPFLTGASLAIDECYYLGIGVRIFGIDYLAEAGEYEVKVSTDTWETAPVHNNVLDELDENNNIMIKTVFIGHQPDQEDIIGHKFGKPDTPVTIQVFYDFDSALVDLIEPTRELLNRYPDQLNAHIVYTTQSKEGSLQRKAAEVAECLSDQGDDYLLQAVNSLSDGLAPGGFNLNAFVKFVLDNVSGDLFTKFNFSFCSKTHAKQNFVNEQIDYATAQGITEPGVIRLIDNNTGVSQDFTASGLDFDEVERVIKDYLGINNSTHVIFNRFNRLNRRR